LIDAMTTMGQKQADDSGGGRGGGAPGGGGGGPQIRGPEDRPGTTPWVSVADELTDDSRAEKWREAGFTTAMSSPSGGLFPGQAALISLGGGEPRDRVVATSVAQRVNFRGGGGFRSFPGSLMGGLSYVKQVLSDTRHYTASKRLYEASPLGQERPSYDRALEPLETAIAHGTPFLMPAHLGREIDRVLAIRAEFNIPTVIYGGQGAYTRVAKLKSTGTPILVSLDWPEEEKDRDPESDTPFRTLYHRRLAPSTPAALAAAGVDFAFYSDTLSGTSAIFEKVRAAVDAGLSDEAALAALSSGAARIFGVGDRLGTIEEGKIANLVLATDWPWAKDAEVQAVFVDGVKYDYQEEEEEGDPPASDVSGTWEVTMQSPRGAQEMTLELEMDEDGKVGGEISTERGDTPVDDGRMSDDLLRFETTRSMGERSFTAKWSLTVEGESLAGTMSAGPMSMEINGERTAKADKDEEETDEEDAEPEVSLDELHEALALYQGPVSRMGTFAVTNATVWTVSGKTIENGTVVVKDGKIAAVGTDVKVPRNATVIDAAGGALIPGIIDAHSHIAIDGGGNEGTVAVSSMVGIADVLNPDDIGIYRALAGGVTSANILHGSSNPIGGQNQVIKLRWGGDADALRFAGATPGIKFALGENPKRSNFRGFGIPQRYPQTRMGVMDVIRQAFTEAGEYRKEWQAYENSNKSGMPPRRDLKLEPLVEIMEGKRLVHSHCYRADEILQLLRLAEEFGFRVATLQHV
ncbi:MAG: amidohydrolase family protein, partial [Planctomycetota bacterium]